MYEEIQKIQFEELKVKAALVGAKIEEPVSMKSEGVGENELVPRFRDPSEYAHLTKEEKEKLTDKMMTAHRAWSAGKLKG